MRWIVVAVGLVIGLVVFLMGAVFFFQGIGVLPGSFMTGQLFWAVVGIVAISVGAVILRFAYRFAREK